MEIGSQILYEDETMDGGHAKGKIVAIAHDRVREVTTYLGQMISGEYVQTKGDNLYRCTVN